MLSRLLHPNRRCRSLAKSSLFCAVTRKEAVQDRVTPALAFCIRWSPVFRRSLFPAKGGTPTGLPQYVAAAKAMGDPGGEPDPLATRRLLDLNQARGELNGRSRIKRIDFLEGMALFTSKGATNSGRHNWAVAFIRSPRAR
jgi:hypothetical protein